MRDKEDVKKKIFSILLDCKHPVTVSELAKEVSLSGKTVRNYLKELQKELQEENIKLVIKPNVGILLDVSEEEKKLLYLGIQIKDDEFSDYTPEYRRQYILNTLLKNKYTYTIQLLADDLFCSKSTIVNDLVEIQKWLERRGLTLQRKQNQGLWIEGNEKNYRRAMMDVFLETNGENIETFENVLDQLDYRIDLINFKKIKQLFPRIDLLKIQEVIQQAEQKLKYNFTDQAFTNLITHIAIAIERVKHSKEIEMDKESLQNLRGKYEFEVAAWVIQQISNIFHMEFSDDEIGYICLHMLGAKIQEDVDVNHCDILLDAQNEEYVSIAKEIITLAGDILDVDLSEDTLLLTALVLHLRPTIVRLKYGLKLRNPMLQTIKNEYTSIFGAAWACSSIFEKKLGVAINEDEVGYIAMHIAVAVGRRSRKVKTVIVCSSGIGTSQLIATRLNHTFHELDIIATVPLSRVTDELVKEADLIISTIPGILSTSKVVYVTAILDATDVLKIKRTLGKIQFSGFRTEKSTKPSEYPFINEVIDEELCFIDRERSDFVEIIQYYGKLMEEQGYVKKGFREDVLDRENKASTVIGKGVAIPHSTKEFVIQSKICIIKLENPVSWKGHKLHLIIILGLKFDDVNITKSFFKHFYEVLDNKQSINRILKASSSSEIIDVFINGGIQSE
ncbi:MAG: BglG family transcription antiterminator [Bacillota bacterium]